MGTCIRYHQPDLSRIAETDEYFNRAWKEQCKLQPWALSLVDSSSVEVSPLCLWNQADEDIEVKRRGEPSCWDVGSGQLKVSGMSAHDNLDELLTCLALTLVGARTMCGLVIEPLEQSVEDHFSDITLEMIEPKAERQARYKREKADDKVWDVAKTNALNSLKFSDWGGGVMQITSTTAPGGTIFSGATSVFTSVVFAKVDTVRFRTISYNKAGKVVVKDAKGSRSCVGVCYHGGHRYAQLLVPLLKADNAGIREMMSELSMIGCYVDMDPISFALGVYGLKPASMRMDANIVKNVMRTVFGDALRDVCPNLYERKKPYIDVTVTDTPHAAVRSVYYPDAGLWRRPLPSDLARGALRIGELHGLSLLHTDRASAGHLWSQLLKAHERKS